MSQMPSLTGIPSGAAVLAAVCDVMEVAIADMPGKTTPRTRPRLQWARNMAAFVMHDLGISDGAIAKSFGGIHRITIIVRRRRMAEKLECTQRYRDHHMAILSHLAASQSRNHYDSIRAESSSHSLAASSLSSV